jgi:hypothetical protein
VIEGREGRAGAQGNRIERRDACWRGLREAGYAIGIQGGCLPERKKKSGDGRARIKVQVQVAVLLDRRLKKSECG